MADRFHAELAELVAGDRVELNKDESSHLLKVMRAHIGDQVSVFDNGREFRAVLEEARSGLATILLEEEVDPPPPPAVRIGCALPWLKGDRTEFLAQKLTELGVAAIVLYRAKREVVKPGDSRMERIHRVVLEACKQCGRADLPAVSCAGSLKDALNAARAGGARCLVLYEKEKELRISAALKSLIAEPDRGFPDVMIATGPEGGFAPEEVEAVAGLAVYVSLGPRILRADTAPIAAAAAVLAWAGEL